MVTPCSWLGASTYESAGGSSQGRGVTLADVGITTPAECLGVERRRKQRAERHGYL